MTPRINSFNPYSMDSADPEEKPVTESFTRWYYALKFAEVTMSHQVQALNNLWMWCEIRDVCVHIRSSLNMNYGVTWLGQFLCGFYLFSLPDVFLSRRWPVLS